MAAVLGGTATSAGLVPPLKWHGGKNYLAKRLWAKAQTVTHVHRGESYAGAIAFTLAVDPEGYSEFINDCDGDLTNFWRVLQDDKYFSLFQRMAQGTPCSEAVYERSAVLLSKPQLDPVSVERAVAFFVCCRQSRAATFKGFTNLSKSRTRRGMNELPSAWLAAIDGLPEIHTRLQRVVILNRDGIACIQSEDSDKTLVYADPPYLPETKTVKQAYRFEMTPTQHQELLVTLSQIQGYFMLSGYHSKMYDEAARKYSWNLEEIELPNNAAGGDTKKRMVECIWSNF